LDNQKFKEFKLDLVEKANEGLLENFAHDFFEGVINGPQW